MSLQDTPQSLRLTIGIFGKTNSGKSTLLNAITGQDFALVSEIPGTTTDPVNKTMEIHGIGPVLFIDTAGFGDETALSEKRLEKTLLSLEKTDVALLVINNTRDIDESASFLAKIKAAKKPFVVVFNDFHNDGEKSSAQNKKIAELQKTAKREDIVFVDAKQKTGIDSLKDAIKRKMSADFTEKTLTGNLCKEGDVVLLVMPQDIQAPKGRLILPQVQILRELLDKKCVPVCCTTDKFTSAISHLKNAPNLIITDSQAFDTVYNLKGENVPLTSFSVLLAANKGCAEDFLRGARKIGELNEKSKVLIAEACTHAPLTEDIGREKIPKKLRTFVENKKVGSGAKLTIDFTSGVDFPTDLSQYDLIIHCGGCMFNRAYVLSRQEKAKAQNVPMTNYGMALAFFSGILDKIIVPQ